MGAALSEINFSAMTDAQIRAYILSHWQDILAFHAYVNLMQQRPLLPSLSQKNGARSGWRRWLMRLGSANKNE